MSAPLQPPVAPQLAKSAKALPVGEAWWYEPKWDGFRAIAFVGDAGPATLQSRNAKPLERYFPEVALPGGRMVLDGEIIIPSAGGGQAFGLLQQRIHPAASRVAMLAQRYPARFVAFDLLALGDRVLLELPQRERRRLLEECLADHPDMLTPGTTDPDRAERWLHDTEGVVAKDMDAPYLPGERRGMVKVKRTRTFRCVVLAWRPGTVADTVGSLILAMYDPSGELCVVGHAAGFTAARKRELREVVRPHETGERGSADPSRWSGDREALSWVAMHPRLVCEVTADQVSDGRIRHGARLVRFLDDVDPRACTTGQLDQAPDPPAPPPAR
ncbi:MAG: ATP-dependent DNA ligase [Thermoleophilia bacterium]